MSIAGTIAVATLLLLALGALALIALAPILFIAWFLNALESTGRW